MNRIKILNYIFGAVIFGMFVLSIITNIITEYFTVDFIWNNGLIIISLTLFTILVYFILLFNFSKNKISLNDLSSIKRLLGILDLNRIEYILRDRQNNVPITLADSKMIENFINSYNSLNNKILDRKINNLFFAFHKSLKEFYNNFSNYSEMTTDGLVRINVDMKSLNHEKYYNIIKELDLQASKAYKDLEKLLILLVKRGHIL